MKPSMKSAAGYWVYIMPDKLQREDGSRRTPAAFLPYQQRWAADLSPVKVYEKSRRIGISWAEAGDDALLAASKNGMDVWYIGYNKDMALEFIEDAATWSRHFNKAASLVEEFVFKDEDKDILSFRIRYASGFKITALSSRPSNLRGKQGKIVIDEAAFHEDLPGLLKAAIAMLMWGGRVVVISTHDGEANEFNSLIQDIRSGKKGYSLHRTTLDDALDEGLYERICLRLKMAATPDGRLAWREELVSHYGDDADEELFCIPSQGSGTYLTRALIETCLSADIPVVRYEQKAAFAEIPDHIRQAEVDDWCSDTLLPLLEKADPKRSSYFGEDFGRSGDLTVIMPLTEEQNASFKALFVLELRNIPFQQQEQILCYVVDRLPNFRGGALDARGNGQYMAERAMQRYGAGRIEQVMLSETWYRENMPRYKSAFEDRTILLPRDADIIDDHRALKMVRGVAKVPDGKNIGQDKKKRHGDSAIAGAMALYAAYTISGGPVEFASTGRRRTFTRMNNFMA